MRSYKQSWFLPWTKSRPYLGLPKLENNTGDQLSPDQGRNNGCLVLAHGFCDSVSKAGCLLLLALEVWTGFIYPLCLLGRNVLEVHWIPTCCQDAQHHWGGKLCCAALGLGSRDGAAGPSPPAPRLCRTLRQLSLRRHSITLLLDHHSGWAKGRSDFTLK